jgi:hypothetical protein
MEKISQFKDGHAIDQMAVNRLRRANLLEGGIVVIPCRS